MPYFADAIFIDASAAIALKNDQDSYHSIAKSFYNETTNVLWVVLNAITHESYTRVRYDLGFRKAIRLYDFLKNDPFLLLSFKSEDEDNARCLLERYSDQIISFNDALCATVMKRYGIYRIFTFDHHFYSFGFEILPGYI